MGDAQYTDDHLARCFLLYSLCVASCFPPLLGQALAQCAWQFSASFGMVCTVIHPAESGTPPEPLHPSRLSTGVHRRPVHHSLRPPGSSVCVYFPVPKLLWKK